MKKLLAIADEYLRESDWKTISVLKICLFSLGILCGMSVREKDKETARIAAGAVFLTCYIPLIVKLVRVIKAVCCQPKPEEPEEEAQMEPESAQ